MICPAVNLCHNSLHRPKFFFLFRKGPHLSLPPPRIGILFTLLPLGIPMQHKVCRDACLLLLFPLHSIVFSSLPSCCILWGYSFPNRFSLVAIFVWVVCPPFRYRATSLDCFACSFNMVEMICGLLFDRAELSGPSESTTTGRFVVAP